MGTQKYIPGNMRATDLRANILGKALMHAPHVQIAHTQKICGTFLYSIHSFPQFRLIN